MRESEMHFILCCQKYMTPSSVQFNIVSVRSEKPISEYLSYATLCCVCVCVCVCVCIFEQVHAEINV